LPQPSQWIAFGWMITVAELPEFILSKSQRNELADLTTLLVRARARRRIGP
jgi:hypothetical protein